MMASDIKEIFCKSLCEQIDLIEERKNYFRVFTPFRFDDGDHLSIVLKKKNQEWVFSDEGHTYMHLSYVIDESDLFRDTRYEIIQNALSEFQIQDRHGELTLAVEGYGYGEALCSFVQGLLKICDVSYLSKERVKSTFYEDFQSLISQIIPWELYQFDWYDPLYDEERIYKVDCRIESPEAPLYVYALSNNERTRDATISLMEFKQWRVPFHSVAIFKTADKISKNVLKKFTKSCDKKFASLKENKLEIATYIRQAAALPPLSEMTLAQIKASNGD